MNCFHVVFNLLDYGALQSQFSVEPINAAQEYVLSVQLRQWVEQNRNRCYVPGWSLNAWRLTVDPQLSDLPPLREIQGKDLRFAPYAGTLFVDPSNASTEA